MIVELAICVVLVQTSISEIVQVNYSVETVENSNNDVLQAPEFVEKECPCVNNECTCKCPPGYGDLSDGGIFFLGRCKACHCGHDISCTFSDIDIFERNEPTKRCHCSENDVEVDGICVGFCASKPCKNGGACSETENGYTCLCPFGFFGTNCDLKIPCLPNPCQNGGLCHSTGFSDYECDCLFGYSGANCNERKSHCDSSPCKNGGTCMEVLGVKGVSLDYRCFCTDDYVGLKCEFPLTSSSDNFAMSIGLPLAAVIIFIISTCYVLVRFSRRSAIPRALLTEEAEQGMDDLPPAYTVQSNKDYTQYPPPSYTSAVQMGPSYGQYKS